MRNLFKRIVVAFRLVKALMIYMPINEIYKAKYIVPKCCKMSYFEEDDISGMIVNYEFSLLDEYTFNKIYKINLEDYL